MGSRLSTRRYWKRAYDTDDGTITADALEGIMEFQNYLCALCGLIPEKRPSFDHIQPLSKGGAHSITNLQMTCWPCNNRKRAKYPYYKTAPSEYESEYVHPEDEWGTQDD